MGLCLPPLSLLLVFAAAEFWLGEEGAAVAVLGLCLPPLSLPLVPSARFRLGEGGGGCGCAGLCTQVSDAVVDACFAQDANSHVACETCTGTNFVMVFGEITTNAEVDYEAVVREAIKDIGFDAPEKGLDYKTCEVSVCRDSPLSQRRHLV